MDAQWKRIDAILANSKSESFEDRVAAFYEHLRGALKLPCDVTGSEDFQWEEPFVLGVYSSAEWARLKKTQPSYRDHFELLGIDNETISEWMLFGGDDLGAHVTRKKDGKEFYLGLAELKAVSAKSPNAQLLDDYSMFFVNSR